MMSTNFSDFWTPSPLPAFSRNLYWPPYYVRISNNPLPLAVDVINGWSLMQ